MNTKLKSQLGRSMVEILGVLAIVGILSVGSLYAYRLAIDKNASNTIINELSQRAIIVSSMKVHGEEANLNEFSDTDFTKTYNVTYNDEGDGYFSITMENVPDHVVQQLIQMKWTLPYNIYINGVLIDDYTTIHKSVHSSL